MTLIVSMVSRTVVLVAADRLVSTDGPFDPTANKLLVCGAADGLVVVGYSGSAYVDGIPTDDFMAREIVGEIEPFPGGGRPVRFGETPVLTIDALIGRWLSAFERAFNSTEAVPGETAAVLFSVHGYRWQDDGGGIPLSLGFSIDKQRRTIQRRVEVPPTEQEIVCWSYGSGSSVLDCARLLAGADGDDFPTAVNRLAFAIKDVAEVEKASVSSDSIIVSVSSDREHPVIVSYRAPGATAGAVKIISDSTVLPDVTATAFSPWLIGKMRVDPPRAHVGREPVDLGNFRVLVDAPDSPPSGMVWGWTGLVRPPDPSRK